jgi:sortase A
MAVRRAARTLTALGVLAALLLTYEFVLSGIPQARTQAELLSAFQQELPTTTLDSPSSAPAEGTPVALLKIPSIGLQQVVVEGTSPEDLKNGPGHLRASPLPGEFGNAVIEGRRTTYGAPFSAINQLHSGDIIRVTTGQGSLVYVVTTVSHVNVGQPDPASPTVDSRMTLLTSDPAYISTGELAVTAKLQGKPLAVATRPPVLAGTADLGLSGDPIGLGFGLIWLELLAASAWLTWRLHLRLPGSVLSMFGAPVMLTLALLAFSNLDSLFPGTM